MNRDDDRDGELRALRKAKADLETLIDTSPVGVVVFDLGTASVSFNQEMRRTVDGLRDEDQAPEQLLEVMTILRADGEEISLEELPALRAMSEDKTVWAEEIVLRVPDGRSVRALLTATPIRSEEGEVESVVAIVQDLTPLEEQERLRAELLSRVGHELCTPLTAVKGSVATLLEPPSPLSSAELRQFFTIIDAQVDRMHLLIGDLLDVARIETGTLPLSPEPTDDAGLRLAVCKGIVEAHGGRIWAESDGPGLGARFSFTVPAVERDEHVPAAQSAPPRVRSSRRRAAAPLRVLALEGDPQALRYVREALLQSGYSPIVTADPEEALRLVEQERPHLVLLDLMLPGADGVALMQSITETADVPVIFLSPHGQEPQLAQALDLGAADYVVKPFSPVELAARIRAALRRRETPEPPAPYVLGGLTIDYAERRVSLDGRPLELTDIEYRTLAELAANAGRVLTYEHLLRRVWRRDADADVRPMRTVVSSLRRKLGDAADDPTYLFTELRVGYRMPGGETTKQEQKRGDREPLPVQE